MVVVGVVLRIYLDHGVDVFLLLLFTLYIQIDIFILHPPPRAPSALLNNGINIVGGWCCCTHLFGVDDFWLYISNYLILIIDT